MSEKEAPANQNRIKQLRLEQHKTQKEVGKAIGLSDRAIAHYEKGIREPKLETWIKLADYFDVTVSYLQGMDVLDRPIIKEKVTKMEEDIYSFYEYINDRYGVTSDGFNRLSNNLDELTKTNIFNFSYNIFQLNILNSIVQKLYVDSYIEGYDHKTIISNSTLIDKNIKNGLSECSHGTFDFLKNSAAGFENKDKSITTLFLSVFDDMAKTHLAYFDNGNNALLAIEVNKKIQEIIFSVEDDSYKKAFKAQNYPQNIKPKIYNDVLDLLKTAKDKITKLENEES